MDADAKKKTKKKTTSQKLNPGWRPGRKKRRRALAAAMIQRAFRSFLLRRAFRQSRHTLRDSLKALVAFHRARDRNHFRCVDLPRLSRDALRLIALSVNVPSTGKKVLLMGRIQRWVDQNVIAKSLAVDAAAEARNKQVRAQGTVYFCEAIPGLAPIEIRPLRGRNFSLVAAGHECDAVYSVDGRDGSVWLCKTGGLSSQVGLCSEMHQRDVFDHPLESRWLVNPEFVHALRSEHVADVRVARSHAVALARAGEIFSWGENQHGQLGFPALSADEVARNRPKVVAAIANYKCVSAGVGTHHTVVVCDLVAGHDGVLFTWGSNVYGQLGTGAVATSSPQKQTTRPAPASSSVQFPKAFVLHRVDSLREVRIRKVACGALHSMALSADGRLYTWGCNDGGRLGLGISVSKQEQRVYRPTLVTGPLVHCIVLEIACGAWHSACIATIGVKNQDEEDHAPPLNAGRVYTWGTGIYGQLGTDEREQIAYYPTPVRMPASRVLGEELAVQLGCGMHHTAALTTKNNVFSWGSMHSFSSKPTPLSLADGAPFGKIASIACGRSFTVFNTLSLTAQSYEREEAYRLWRVKQTRIPKLNLSNLPHLPLSSSLPGIDHPLPLRLEPQEDRKSREAREFQDKQRIDEIDIYAIVHPMCRVCWRCDGFHPSPLKLWICRQCFHEKELHGARPEGTPLSEFEAVRKIQCLYRAKRAKRVLQQARERHYQRVFSIKHNAFFYYNLWQNSTSWARPDEVPQEVEIPIRDPDDKPQIAAPLTTDGAAVVLQKHWRAHVAHLECKRQLRLKYEKHFDLKKERLFYKVIQQPQPTPTRPVEQQRLILYEEPMLLRRLYDLGEPIEIARLKKFANMSHDDAAKVVQKLFRAYQARQLTKRIIERRLRKLLDEKTGQFYYYNTVTKVSMWGKPKVLGAELEEDGMPKPAGKTNEATGRVASPIVRQRKMTKLPPRQAKFETDHAAARTIQSLYRRFRSRKLFFELLRRRYVKIVDDATGKPYYYDRVSGTSSWLKPAVFGEFDLAVHALPTESSRAAEAPERDATSYAGVLRRNKRKQVPYISEKAKIKREKRRLQKLRQLLTPHEAACYIQRAWRVSRAHRELKARLLAAYEKICDDTTGCYYYYNKQTGKVSWEKPALLAEHEVKLARIVRRRREYTISDSVEAQIVVVGFARRCLARKELVRLLHERIQKVFDPEAKQYYYFDRRTGQSAWTKPLLLGERDLLPST